MDNIEQSSKSKSVMKIKIEDSDSSPNKKLNFKGKQLSFSQASEISEDTKENYKFFSPVSYNSILFKIFKYSYQPIII